MATTRRRHVLTETDDVARHHAAARRWPADRGDPGAFGDGYLDRLREEWPV